MIFGNASWGFRETPLEEQLRITKDMGLAVLELGIANAPKDVPLSVTDEEIAEIKDSYKKYGIELCCAATGNDFSNGDKNDLPKVRKVIDICEKLGVKYLRIFAGFSPVAEVKGERWDNMIECLKEVAEYAKDKNVYPVVETHGGVTAFDDGVEHFLSTSAMRCAVPVAVRPLVSPAFETSTIPIPTASPCEIVVKPCNFSIA